MGPDHAVVVDISSDEEEDLGRADLDGASLDWFDLLDRGDGPRPEESDDVIVVDEFSAPAVKRRKQNSGPLEPLKGGGVLDDDDDCLVLDSDPDKPVSVANDKSGDGDGGDDLLIVAEKGQLACRDYPHPRHLCAKFLFSSSPHEKYCDLCHCYVCDSPAPCNCWGNGNLSTDHCHSTDKEGRWKSLRQSFKQKNTVVTQPTKLTDYASLNIPPFRDPVPLRQSDSNPLLVPRRCRSNLLRPCSASSITNSNVINQRNQCQPTVLSCHSQRLGLQPTKSYPLSSGVQHIRRESRVAGALTSQLMYSRTRYKRTGTMQAGFTSLNNRSHNPVSNNNHIPSTVPQKSSHVMITSQRPWCPQVAQQRSQDPLVTSFVGSTDQMQPTVSSRSTEATMQSSMCSPVTAADDDSQKSWQDILASVASELGVSLCSDTGITDAQQSHMVPSPSRPHDKSFSGTRANQDTESVPAMANTSSLDYNCTWSNDTMAPTSRHNQGEDLHLSTFETSNAMVFRSNTVSEETCLDSFFTSTENEIP